MPIPMQKRVAVAVLVVIVGALSIFACASAGGLGVRAGDEDRPPIIVRGGSLHLESYKNWKEVNDKDWKPDHPNGKSVDGYQVIMFGTSCKSEVFTGDSVRISYSEGTDSLTVELGRLPSATDSEPVVRPSKNMRRESDKKVLSYGRPGAGQIARIEVLNGMTVVAMCELPSRAWIFPVKN